MKLDHETLDLLWPGHLLNEIAGLWPGDVTEVKPLYGDSDLNVRVAYADGSLGVLKVSKSGSKEAAQLIELQVATLRHIAGKTGRLACSVPIPFSPNNYVEDVVAGDDSRHHAWMLCWLPGSVLDDEVNYGIGLLYSIGRSMALVDRALLDFEHPVAHRHISWDLANILELQDWLKHISDPYDRNLADHCFQLLGENMLPGLVGRPRSVIHNDGGNQHNMLTGKGNDGEACITGVIDFGDTVYTHRVNELGIACAYATFGDPDLAATIADVAAGYNEVLPLDGADELLLPWLVMARFLMSVCHAAERASREPDNTYAQVSAQNAWRGLRHINSLDMIQISNQIRERLIND